MKKLILFIVCLTSGTCFAQTGRDNSIVHDCIVSREYGFKTVTFMLSGSVYVVTNPNEHADLRVKVVDDPGIAVLYVYRTNKDDFDCGIWRFVKNRRNAKFTVRFVKEHEQIAIYYVSSPKEAGSRY